MSLSSSTVGGKIKYKLVLLGDQHVGKTSVIQRFINDRYQTTYNPTIGIDFLVKNIPHNNKMYRLQLWDTAGQERFKSLIPSYLKDSNVCLLIYDVTNPESLKNLAKWMELYEQHKEYSAFSVIIGNKSDLACKDNSNQQMEQLLSGLFSKQKQYKISAKTGQGVQEMMREVIELINQSLDNIKIIDQIEQREEKEEAGVGISQTVKPVLVQQQDTSIKLKLPVEQVKKENQPKRRCC